MAHAGPPWRGWGGLAYRASWDHWRSLGRTALWGMEESGYAIWKGSCLVGNDPLPKLGRLEPEGYAGRYLYCQVAFWAKLLPDSEEIPLPFPLF